MVELVGVEERPERETKEADTEDATGWRRMPARLAEQLAVDPLCGRLVPLPPPAKRRAAGNRPADRTIPVLPPGAAGRSSPAGRGGTRRRGP